MNQWTRTENTQFMLRFLPKFESSILRLFDYFLGFTHMLISIDFIVRPQKNYQLSSRRSRTSSPEPKQPQLRLVPTSLPMFNHGRRT